MIISKRKVTTARGIGAGEELIVDADTPAEAAEIAKREFLRNNPDIDPDKVRITLIEKVVVH